MIPGDLRTPDESDAGIDGRETETLEEGDSSPPDYLGRLTLAQIVGHSRGEIGPGPKGEIAGQTVWK